MRSGKSSPNAPVRATRRRTLSKVQLPSDSRIFCSVSFCLISPVSACFTRQTAFLRHHDLRCQGLASEPLSKLRLDHVKGRFSIGSLVVVGQGFFRCCM